MRWIIATCAVLALLLLIVGSALTPTSLEAQTPTATSVPATATDVSTQTPAPATQTPAVVTATTQATQTPFVVTATFIPTFTVTPGPSPTPVPPPTNLYVPLILRQAQDADTGGRVETGLQVQNLSPNQADLTVQYYDRDGQTRAEWTERASVAANDSNTFFTPANTALPQGFAGSAVIQSTQPVGALVNVQAPSDAAQYFLGTFVAPRVGANVVYMPYALKQVGSRTSTIVVQNTSPTQTLVEARFFTRDGQAGAFQVPVPAFSARSLRLADRPELAGGADASLVLRADQPIVAVGNVYDSSTGIFQSYSGLPTGSNSQLAPLLFGDRNGWDTDIRVQNAGSASVSVRVRVQPTGGGTEIVSAPVAVAPGAPYTFRPRDVPAIGSNFVGSATVEANGAVVAIASQTNPGRSTGMAYDAFGPNAGTPRISVPLIFRDRNGFDTGIQLQNVDSTDAQVRVTYRLADGATVIDFGVVPANGSFTFYQPDNPNIPAGSVGSAIVESLDGIQRLVAIVNEVNYIRGGDASSTYEGLNY